MLIEPLRLNAITTRSGLMIPDKFTDSPSEGIVVKIGGKVNTEEVPVKIGDRVFFNRHEGQPVVIGDTHFTLFASNELLAIID